MANTVTVEVKADTKKAQSNIGKFGSKVKNAAPQIAVASAALAGASAMAVKLGDEFIEATRIIAAGTGASGDDLKDLEKSFKNVFKNVPADSKDVATALADLNTELGLTGKQLESAAEQFLNMSRIMGADASTSIQEVSDVMKLFGVEASEVNLILDKFAVVSQASGVPIDNLAKTVRKFSPALINIGFELDEVVTLFAHLTANGIEAKTAMPALSAALAKLGNEGATDLKGALEGLVTQIQDTTDSTESLNLANKYFGTTGGAMFMTAIKNGAFSVDAYDDILAEASGTLEQLSKDHMTAGEKVDIFKNKLKAIVAPTAIYLAQIGYIVAAIPALVSGIMYLTKVTWIQTAAQTALNIALSPITLIILGIIAVIALIVLAIIHWDEIMLALTKTLEFLKEKWAIVWDWMKNKFTDVMGFIQRIYNSKLGWILPGGALIKAFIFLKDNWRKLWDDMLSIIENILDKIEKAVGGVTGAIDKVKSFNPFTAGVPDWIPGFGGDKNILPNIPKMAQGGIVTKPTVAMLGERGREAVIPLNRAGGGGMGVNVTINGDVFGFDDFEDRVQEAVRDGARRGGFQGILSTA